MAGEQEHQLVTIPADLQLIGDDSELQALETQVEAEFDRVSGEDVVTAKSIEYLQALSVGLSKIRAELHAREVRTSEEAASTDARLREQRDALQAQVHGTTREALQAAPPQVDAAQVAQATAEGMVAALVASGVLGSRPGTDLETVTQRATRSLAAARSKAPAQVLPTPRATITAGVDIPGIARGGELTDLDAVVDAFHRRAKGMPITRGAPNEQLVATVRNEFEHTVDDRTSPSQVEELFRYLTTPEKQDALVAGGGWCAPSEIRYDFFNVAEADGLVDLPTFGVSRGGVRFPTSPTIADAFGANGLAPFATAFTNASVPWLWTEADDIATVTGSPNKPTMRVPCPSFNEVRLECYGITMTAGNLTDDAYPEATRNTLRLLTTAHAHAMNARIINTMVTASTAAVSTGGFSELNDAVTQIMGGLQLAAADYRARYAMGLDVVLEVVGPYWVRDVLRAALRWRLGVDSLSITDAQIAGYFADINVRAQWVNDWQVRGAGQFGNVTPMTAWPTAATFMLYAAGTFLLGNGLSLDLGVVRDSTLNAENDFTAAWTEECHLVAKVGHESRLYTIAFNVSALTPPAATAAPNL